MPEYFNTTNQPVVYNYNGQIAGGAEWFTSVESDLIRKYLAEGIFLQKEEANKNSGKSDKKS